MNKYRSNFSNGERHQNKELKDKAKKVEKRDEAAQIILEFEQIIRSKYKNMVGIPTSQVFEKFKENVKFIEMVKQFGVGKSTIIFKIKIVKLINKYPKAKNSSLSLKLFKKLF